MLILHAKNVRDYYLIYLIFPAFTNLGWPITFHGGEEDWFGCEWKVIIIIFLMQLFDAVSVRFIYDLNVNFYIDLTKDMRMKLSSYTFCILSNHKADEHDICLQLQKWKIG